VKVSKLLTPADVAERLNVCRATVYARIRAGDLPALTLAQFTSRPVYRVDAGELDAWLDAAHVKPTRDE